MDSHKYRVGQLVVLKSSVPSEFSSPIRQYKILRLLDCEGENFIYRIKTITEKLDRIVMERDIAPFTPLLWAMSTGSRIAPRGNRPGVFPRARTTDKPDEHRRLV